MCSHSVCLSDWRAGLSSLNLLGPARCCLVRDAEVTELNELRRVTFQHPPQQPVQSVSFVNDYSILDLTKERGALRGTGSLRTRGMCGTSAVAENGCYLRSAGSSLCVAFSKPNIDGHPNTWSSRVAEGRPSPSASLPAPFPSLSGSEQVCHCPAAPPPHLQTQNLSELAQGVHGGDPARGGHQRVRRSRPEVNGGWGTVVPRSWLVQEWETRAD